MFIDFHTHILPGIDDGASDISMSLEMLSILQKQGVGIVAATPHMYLHRQPLSEFMLQRQRSLNLLLANQYEGMPSIVPGAEVYIERGIRHVDIRPLCYGDTNYILLELPYSNYQSWFLEEVYHLCLTQSMIPVFAHLDRYIDMYSDTAMEEILDFDDAVIQINQEAVFDSGYRNTVFKRIKEGRPVVFGSDCHNVKYRTSKEGRLQSILKSKLGSAWLENYEKFTLNIIGKSK
ncbi:MAG: capsular polysaccharide biosynthesis protein [Oscillospiraceae bacterium]|nr:capsular polysaccharide biosynthesis protein [Oscillospiraceae bacterium]MDD4414973.1 capsular polysaccharide biosynthesis protein [Oscillospiraceae bacterium]